MVSHDNKNRCFGNKPGQILYAKYHDEEWGVPVHDDRKLFEFLVLEGAQAGLNWETILKRREEYRKAFHRFDVVKVAEMSDAELAEQCHNQGIVRNRLKIFSVRKNARIFQLIQKEFGSFDKYLWGFIGGNQIKNSYNVPEEVPASTKESQEISKDLKSRGMSFVGPTIIYAYMQAVGLVNDHLTSCWCYNR